MHIINHDGTTTYLGEPTTTDRQKREIKEAREKNDLRVAKMVAEQAEKERLRRAALPSADDRFSALLLGTTRSAAKCRRTGDLVKAAKLTALGDEIAGELAVWRKLSAEGKKPVATPLQDAIVRAAAELVKRLPACFATEDEAREFAGRCLPLTSARAEQARVNDAFGKARKEQSRSQNRLWDKINEAAAVATGRGDTGALSVLEDIGTV